MSDLGALNPFSGDFDVRDAVLAGSDPIDAFGFQAAKDAEAAALSAAEIQARAGQEAIAGGRAATEQALGFFEPFAGAAQSGIEGASFLANPQEQFDFLQNNPLFNLALENANQRTLQSASANRRLSFGDTLQQLSNNVLLQSAPLIDRQRQDVTNLLQFGGDVATSQANIATGQEARIGDITTDIGAARAAGLVGGANAQLQANQNLQSGLFTAGAIFASDERLKTNKKIIGKLGDLNWWSWDWNELAGKLLGLFGSDEGVMAHEVLIHKPSAAIMGSDGYYRVNYGEL
jgi:hypothetical protein